jgi:hypothetical protein
MKLIKGILGCALAAGLTTFVSTQAQAGTVIDGELWSTVNLKLLITYNSSDTKISKKTVTSKQVLKELGYNSSVVLAVEEIDGNFIFGVINTKNKTVIQFLTDTEDPSEGILTANPSGPVVSTTKEGKNSLTQTAGGTIEIIYDSEFDENEATIDDSFDIEGVYAAQLKETSKNTSTNVKISGLSGTGFFGEIDDDAVVTGSATVKGNGQVEE